MTAVPLAPAVSFGDDGRVWRRALLRCALCALLVILLFWRDARDVVTIWATVSTYHHCALVVLLAGWSVWQRRQEVAGIPPDIWWTGLWLTALGALGRDLLCVEWRGDRVCGGCHMGAIAGPAFGRRSGHGRHSFVGRRW
jgi:Transmembrane exosortase (Exosortase_EpsH)